MRETTLSSGVSDPPVDIFMYLVKQVMTISNTILVKEKAKILNLKASLQSHNLDGDIADYLKADVDADAFSAAIEKVVSARLTAGGYKPTGHQNNQPITKAEFDKMSYSEKADLYNRDPELWKRFKH